jgi:hypothetical protein
MVRAQSGVLKAMCKLSETVIGFVLLSLVSLLEQENSNNVAVIMEKVDKKNFMVFGFWFTNSCLGFSAGSFFLV